MGLYARPLHVRLPVGLDPLPALLSLSSSSVRTQKIRKSVSESNYPRFKNEGEKKEAS